MTNFGFVRSTLPTLHADCAKAEAYLTSDPRSACFYSRCAVEGLVRYLYDVLALPYQNDLGAFINDSAFKNATGSTINQKLDLIRRASSAAVQQGRPIRPDVALALVRELHHVMVWAAFHHSPQPDAVPTRAQFDPSLAAELAPLTRDEVVALAERGELATSNDAEIVRLRQEIKAAQAATTQQDDHDYTEAETRDLFIDVLLAEAGWLLADARDREYEVTGMLNAEGKGFVDYVLWGDDGLPLAVVETKRTRMGAAVGQQQAKLYADCLEAMFGRRPVIFYTNGYQHWIWDDAAGHFSRRWIWDEATGYPPREIQGFYRRDELELMIQRRRTRLTLVDAPLDAGIVDRPDQKRASRAIGADFDKRHREALEVMAAGPGRTRTVIALVDQLMKANWVKRVLVLADLTAVVNQTALALKQYLPSVTTVNLPTEKATDGGVYVSTYPTILNLINEVDESGRRFGPGYFDLIVIDEVHRWVYDKYGAIFDHFDAMLVGFTATPKDELDHNTRRLFNLEDGCPADT